MNKIICDICGTAYPENAEQCPICGSAKQIDNMIVSDNVSESVEQPAKTATKGGHFSNTNVRKRNKGKAVPVAAKKPAKSVKSEKPAKSEMPAKAERPAEKTPEQNALKNAPVQNVSTEKNEKSNRGLLVVVWVLLIAVVLVLAYIVIRFLLPMYGIELPDLLGKADETTSAVADTTAAQDTTAGNAGVACTDLTVDCESISFDAIGRAWQMTVTVEPADTTDQIEVKSNDENIATVKQDSAGRYRVTSVGSGDTVITVTCGNMVRQVKVYCSAPEDTTVPEETTLPEETTVPVTSEEPTTEEPTTEEPTESTEATEPPAESFGLLKQNDVTLAYKGETFEFETDGAYLSEIVWTSNDPTVATVENGEVTAVGSGITTIYAEHNGRKDSCIIRCSFDDEAADAEQEEEGDSEYPRLWPSNDVSIRLDESFELDYVNADREWTDIDWSSNDESVAVVNGNVVTGVGYGNATISGTYNGEEITCIVRVRSDLE